MADPITVVYKKIVETIKATPAAMAHLDPKNLIDFSERSIAAKETLSGSDVPEVQLLISNILPVIGESSSSSRITATFELSVLSNDRDLSLHFAPLLFALVGVLYKLRYGALDGLTWGDGSSIQTDVQPTSASSGLASPAESRGISGWMSIWSVDVSMIISNSQLASYIDG